MKKLFLFSIISIFFISCSTLTNEEALIKEYLEKVDANTTIDLNFKPISTEFIKVAKLGDSITFIENDLEASKEILKNICDEQRKYYYNKAINSGSPETIKVYSKYYDEYLEITKLFINDKIDSIIMMYPTKGDIEYKNLKSTNEKIQFINQNKDNIVGNIWECKYSIINPMLNNAKQETTNTFLFNIDNTMIIRKIEQ